MTSCLNQTLPRVLYVADLDPGQKCGTFEDQARELAGEFAKRGGLFLPLYRSPLGHRALADYQRRGIQAEDLDLTSFQISRLFQLAGLVRRYRIEIVHWNFYEPLRNPYLWGLSLLAPFVAHYYTDHISRVVRGSSRPHAFRHRIKRLLYRRYRRIFCVSDFVATQLQEGDQWPNVVRWNHLVDTQRFALDLESRRETRRRFGVEDRLVLLVVAQLRREKGVDVAIRAIARLPDDIVVWVVGDGEERIPLELLAESLGITDRVTFLGLQWDVSEFMQAADCLLCPSRWCEAAGLVNIEALASGLPVIGSRIGGIPEFIEEGETGFLFPAEDDSNLATLLASIRSDSELLSNLRLNARGTALERYSLAGRIDDYVAYYQTSQRIACTTRESLGTI